jgi:hypothetical protein
MDHGGHMKYILNFRRETWNGKITSKTKALGGGGENNIKINFNQGRAHINKVLNLRGPESRGGGNLSTGSVTIAYSKMTLLRGVSYSIIHGAWTEQQVPEASVGVRSLRLRCPFSPHRLFWRTPRYEILTEIGPHARESAFSDGQVSSPWQYVQFYGTSDRQRRDVYINGAADGKWGN